MRYSYHVLPGIILMLKGCGLVQTCTMYMQLVCFNIFVSNEILSGGRPKYRPWIEVLYRLAPGLPTTFVLNIFIILGGLFLAFGNWKMCTFKAHGLKAGHAPVFTKRHACIFLTVRFYSLEGISECRWARWSWEGEREGGLGLPPPLGSKWYQAQSLPTVAHYNAKTWPPKIIYLPRTSREQPLSSNSNIHWQ